MNGQFGTADNLAPRTIWHHGQFGTAIKFDKFDNVVQSIHPQKIREDIMSEKTHFVKKKVSGGPYGPKGEPFLLPNCFKNLKKLSILVFICQTFWAGTLSFMSGGPHGPKREPLFLPNRKSLHKVKLWVSKPIRKKTKPMKQESAQSDIPVKRKIPKTIRKYHFPDICHFLFTGMSD